MGIALPQWIIEGKNNIWVLGLYGVLFGGVLPVLVVRLYAYFLWRCLRGRYFCMVFHVILTFVYVGSMVVR
jgi:hypothetical protein